MLAIVDRCLLAQNSAFGTPVCPMLLACAQHNLRADLGLLCLFNVDKHGSVTCTRHAMCTTFCVLRTHITGMYCAGSCCHHCMTSAVSKATLQRHASLHLFSKLTGVPCSIQSPVMKRSAASAHAHSAFALLSAICI